MDVELDKISSLPGQIKEQILSRVPIKDAVRTSILSSTWRYKWAEVPQLVIDNQCLSFSSQDRAIFKYKLMSIVDHVLLLHFGPIQKFKLSHPDLLPVNDIDRFILYLSRGSIKEFVLEIRKEQRYSIPSCLFSCQNLTHLELLNCLLKPPLAFEGFRSLKSLDLQKIAMSQHAFERMISSCSLLEKLTLMNFDGFNHLNIEAPNLKELEVGGVFEDVSFKNTSHLAVISIGLYEYDLEGAPSDCSNLHKFFEHLPVLRWMKIQNYLLKYLAVGGVLGKLPKPCVNLKYLSIHISLNDVEETPAAICLLASAPNLRVLEILARKGENIDTVTTNYFWENYRFDCQLTQLKLVKVTGVYGFISDLEMIKFILSNSPVLETMIVKPAPVNGGWDFIKKLLRFRRASVRAEVIYVDP